MGGTPHAGLGSEMFISASSLTSSGTIMPPQGTAHAEEDIENDDGDNTSTSSSVSSVVVALATATLADSSWQLSPSYPPQYLSTISEYLPSPKQPPTMSTGAVADDGDTQKGHPWATEKYENSMRTDHIFDRFVERAGHEPQQCVRWALCLFYTEIDHLSDRATSIGTILAEFPCHLRQITYTSSYFHHCQTTLKFRQRPNSVCNPKRRGVGTVKHLSLPVHFVVLVGYSNFSSCPI